MKFDPTRSIVKNIANALAMSDDDLHLAVPCTANFKLRNLRGRSHWNVLGIPKEGTMIVSLHRGDFQVWRSKLTPEQVVKCVQSDLPMVVFTFGNQENTTQHAKTVWNWLTRRIV